MAFSPWLTDETWGREVTPQQKTLFSNPLTYHTCPAYPCRLPFTFIQAVGYVSTTPAFCRHAQFLEDISMKTSLLLTNEQLQLTVLAAWGYVMNVRLGSFLWRARSPLNQQKKVKEKRYLDFYIYYLNILGLWLHFHRLLIIYWINRFIKPLFSPYSVYDTMTSVKMLKRPEGGKRVGSK